MGGAAVRPLSERRPQVGPVHPGIGRCGVDGSGSLDMVHAIPAGIALAATSLTTTWVSRQFDRLPPVPWTTRRHMREIVSIVVMTAWMAALLIAGGVFQLEQMGLETVGDLAWGIAIAILGTVPAILLYVQGRRTARAARPARR